MADSCDLPAVRADIEMAARSPEMARHVALDHAPQLIAEIERLRESPPPPGQPAGSKDDSAMRLIDLSEYAVTVLWKHDGECLYGGNGDVLPVNVPASLRMLADLIEKNEGEKVTP